MKIKWVLFGVVVFVGGVFSSHLIDPQLRHRDLWRKEQKEMRERIGKELQEIDLVGLNKTNLAQFAIIGTFLDSFCGKPSLEGDAFHAGATAVMSVVARRAGLGSYTTAEAEKCLITPPPGKEFLARLAAVKEEAELRKIGMRRGEKQ